MKTVAILGSSGHIAKGLIFELSKDKTIFLNLYDLNPSSVRDFLHQNLIISQNIKVFELKKFFNSENDSVINCIGVGAPNKIKELGAKIQLITEEFDNLIISYLQKKPSRLYINLSSGVVYGGDGPFKANSTLALNPNELDNPYQMAKLNAESKHRSLSNLNIIDLRIFSYFSRFVDLKSGFLMTDITLAILEKKPLKTNSMDFDRDFIDMEDLAELVKVCLKKRKLNISLDAYSKKPTSKSKLITYFKKKYNLKVKLADTDQLNPTGSKSKYYSLNHVAKMFGYEPKYNALESIAKEISFIIKNK